MHSKKIKHVKNVVSKALNQVLLGYGFGAKIRFHAYILNDKDTVLSYQNISRLCNARYGKVAVDIDRLFRLYVAAVNFTKDVPYEDINFPDTGHIDTRIDAMTFVKSLI